MNAYTRVSGKGQIVVPKAVRDRMGWAPGTDLEVVEVGDTITLRRRPLLKTLTVEQAVARFRQIYQHQGPPVSIEQMKREAQEVAANGVTDA